MSSKNEFETRCGWKRDGHVVSQALPSLSHTREGVSAREQDSVCGCAACAYVAAAALLALLPLKNIIFNFNFYLVGHTDAQHMGGFRMFKKFCA